MSCYGKSALNLCTYNFDYLLRSVASPSVKSIKYLLRNNVQPEKRTQTLIKYIYFVQMKIRGCQLDNANLSSKKNQVNINQYMYVY